METKKTNWKSRIKMAAVTGLAALLGTVNTCFAESPKVYVESGVVSAYVGRHGWFKEGLVNQNMISADFNNGLSAFAWQNYDFNSGKVNEIDSGIMYSRKIEGNLSANVGFQHWNYLNGEFGDCDNVVKAGAKLTGPVVDVQYDFTHIIGHNTTPTGDRHYFKVSKTFPLGNLGKNEIAVTPSLGASLLDDYYGKTGLSQVTPGVNLSVKNGRWSFNAFVNAQDGKLFNDLLWGGVSLGYSF